jgi:4,5:9,10-diseco-3-hydroxy-5,9,17-trioxoandrosta-1(10),2-diene-4-oate hydrolase
VILLHGGSGSVEFWLHNIGVLAQSHRVFAFDMVGSGLSDKPSASYSLVEQAGWIQGFMTVLKIQRVTLVGNSMGGGAALQFALLYPERLEKLVLVDSMGLGREIAIGPRLASLPGVVQLLQPSPALFQRMLRDNFHPASPIPQQWFDLRYPIFALPGRQPALAQLARTHFNLGGVRPRVFCPIVEQLPRIQVPTLILWGKQDRILPVTHAYVAAEALPNATMHFFDPCGHHPHLECPTEFNQMVLKFLAT